MKALIWSALVLWATLWTAAAYAVSALLRWGLALAAAEAGRPGPGLEPLSMPAWLLDWVGVGRVHAVLDAVAGTLASLWAALPMAGWLLGWLLPLTWVVWGLGMALLVACAVLADRLLRRS